MFDQPRIKGIIFTDTMIGRYKSLDVNSYAQVFSNDYFFTATYHMDKNSLSGQGLRGFISDFGFMDRLVCDISKDHTSKGTDFMNKYKITG